MKNIMLRPLNSKHCKLLYNLLNDERVYKYGNSSYLYPENINKVEKKLEKWMNSESQKHFVIVKDEKEIGIAQIFNVDFISRKCSVGILLLPNETNKGIGTEVLEKLIEIVFNKMNIHKIETELISKNIASKKMLEKCHFELEGTLKYSQFVDGEYENILMYGLINDKS